MYSNTASNNHRSIPQTHANLTSSPSHTRLGIESRPLEANPTYLVSRPLIQKPLSSGSDTRINTQRRVSTQSDGFTSRSSSLAPIHSGQYTTVLDRSQISQKGGASTTSPSYSSRVQPSNNTSNININNNNNSRTPVAPKLSPGPERRKGNNISNTSNSMRQSMGPRPANYNDLMVKEQIRASGGMDTRGAVGDYPTPSSSEPAKGLTLSTSNSMRVNSNPAGASSSPLLTHSDNVHAALGVPTVSGFMEGPLPPEVRAIITAACGRNNEKGDEAERQARRLLSTGRRAHVYRDELRAAQAEVADVQSTVQQQQLVRSALHVEINELDAHIERLVQERRLCEAQLEQQNTQTQRQHVKLQEAQQRVTVLHQTVENISKETHMGQMMLRQLVPNLNIENYM